MYYSLIGILALLILIITNHDVILKKAEASMQPVQKTYRRFLLGIMIFYFSDILWGLMETLSLSVLLFIDTEIYFIAMALGILFWTQYVIAYLGEENALRAFLNQAGRLFFIAVTAVSLINAFYPILFRVDESGVYHAMAARHAVLIVQILILLLTSVYALGKSSEAGIVVKSRHYIIGLSGLTMMAFISIQLFFPHLPFCSIAYMLGSCLLRTFVIENEKEEYRKGLEIALQKEKQQLLELNKAREMAYTDALTKVKSKGAFANYQQELQNQLDEGKQITFAIGMLDCDNLKMVNDQYGHDKGDEYLKTASRVICQTFHHSPVFRIGGDEFAVGLQNMDFQNRETLAVQFDQAQKETNASAENPWNRVRVALGIAVYDPKIDMAVTDTVRRADQAMYENKRKQKTGR